MFESQHKDGDTPETSASELLTELQAAHHLGVTPELVLGYTRWNCDAKPRRLCTTEIEGRTYFESAELDNFDHYLRQPWVVEGSERVPVPKYIVDHLHAESGNQCTRCGSGIGVQTAHIAAWSMSRSHHHHNLVRICSRCHNEYDTHKSLSSDQLRAIKDKAVARTRAMLARRMNPIDRHFIPPPPETRFVGRSEDLQTLREALEANRTVLISGPGGVGKTQLLLHALASTKTERHVVWLEVERYAALEGLVTALAVMLTEGEGTDTLDALSRRLDALQACVVLDGVERFIGPALDEVDDLLADLKNRTKNTQFVVTSQVELQRTPFDRRHVLSGLEAEPSRSLFRSLVQHRTNLDNVSEAALLAFAEGHPLTLRLTAVLVNYLGSGRDAREQIEKKGARVVEIPKRTEQDRQTSLVRCLSLAYETLNADEQRLLYLIASCPGGIFAHQIEHHVGTETPLLVAALRCWSLVQTNDKGLPTERSYVLSPIRAYAKQRWYEEHPSEARALAETLLHDFAMMAAVIDMQSDDAANVPHMLSRFSEELPNLLLVIDEAEVEPGNADLGLLASVICTALMRFFFIARLPEQGVQLMKRGAKIAMRCDNGKSASAKIVQAAALAQRSHDPRIADEVESMLDDIPTEDAETSGNMAVTRAMLANQRGHAPATEMHARDAIAHYQVVQNELAMRLDQDTEDPRWEENSNDLSGSFNMLGHALLSLNSPEEAQTAYESALQLMSGGAVAVNEGQILHQIGICRARLGEHADATDYYARAAVCFQAVGMQDYLSNALGGLGHALMEFDDERPLPEALPSMVLSEGLDDAVASAVRCLSARPQTG